ncbi:unnamed protein product [Cuscuta europaea]|uniref:Uncharacterized protein n=1 Tax=Cuscuta europaea TaxID=41803 RepID=A0A9P0ZP46_CUSEU|nr:unnamed protein product [Cuscuta europaea]
MPTICPRFPCDLSPLATQYYNTLRFNPSSSTPNPIKCRRRIITLSTSSAPGDVDLNPLMSALSKKDSQSVEEALDELRKVGWAKRWSSQPYVSCRTTYVRELTSLGMKNAENLAIPSVRNDDLASGRMIGSAREEDGLYNFDEETQLNKQGCISLHSSRNYGVFGCSCRSTPWVAYLIGIPILGYSLDIGKENVNLIDERLEKLIYSGQLDSKELDRLAVVAMAGLAAEGLKYNSVLGQSADLFTLQRLINRSKPTLNKEQQQNLTRWAGICCRFYLRAH